MARLDFVILFTPDVGFRPGFIADRPERPPAAIKIGFVLDDVPAAYQRAIDTGCNSTRWEPTIALCATTKVCSSSSVGYARLLIEAEVSR